MSFLYQLRYFDPRRIDESRRDFKRRKDHFRLTMKIRQKESGFKGGYKECYLCGGQAPWCSICECYTRTCCVEYGTCMCS